MFKATRRKLTLLYASLFFCLLLAFAAIVLMSSTWLILNELKQEVRLLAHEEAEEQQAVYTMKGVFIGNEEESEFEAEGSFYYVMDRNGVNVSASVPLRLQPAVMEAAQSWQEPAGTTKLIKTHLEKGQTVLFLLSSEPITDEAGLLATVYFGKDITSYYVLFCNSIIGLAFTLLLFLLLALGVGYLLAGRAMTPIMQSFARQREFTADASHELRTPLSIILASTDVLQGDKGTVLSPFAQQVLEDMKDEVRKMTKLVNDLLTLARADSGVIVLQKMSFDLIPAAAQVIRMIEPLAKAKGLQLTMTSPSSLFVTADESRIRQMIFILLDNAVKYTPVAGDVKLIIEMDEIRQGVHISVTDTGIGIALEEQQKIFNRFYRSDKARSRELGGSGLGLAIAAQIVTAHKGTIRVISSPGQGAVFTVFLPLSLKSSLNN